MTTFTTCWVCRARRFAHSSQSFFRDPCEWKFVSLYLQPFVGPVFAGLCNVFSVFISSTILWLSFNLDFHSSIRCFVKRHGFARFGGKIVVAFENKVHVSLKNRTTLKTKRTLLHPSHPPHGTSPTPTRRTPPTSGRNLRIIARVGANPDGWPNMLQATKK